MTRVYTIRARYSASLYEGRDALSILRIGFLRNNDTLLLKIHKMTRVCTFHIWSKHGEVKLGQD